MDAEALVIDAFAGLGIEVLHDVGNPSAADLVVDPDGVAVALQVKRRSLVTDPVAERLLAEASSAATLLVVADRITETARHVLTASGAGYVDLRGRLAVRTNRLVIDAEVPAIYERTERSDALSGKAGLEVAAALLMEPRRGFAVRELARGLGRSPSTVSEVLAVLRRDGLADENNAVIGTDLFWQLADRWRSQRTPLAKVPPPDDLTLAAPLRLGLNDVTATGWALTDSAAAVAYGVPLAVRSDRVLDFYVPDQATLRRATTLLGPAPSTEYARATVRVAPVPSTVQRRVKPDRYASDWPLAHPLFVALDLAQDIGRGREVLDAWAPDERWSRVW